MAASADIMGRNSRNFPGTALRPSASPWLTASSEGVSPMCRMAAITAGSVTQICLVFRFSFLVLLWHLWQFPESKRMFSGFPQIPRGRWSCSHQRGSIRSQSASRGLTSNATCDMWYLYTVRSTGFFVRRLDTLACLKVDIDAMDMDGCTALHLAVKHDSVDEARTLIELEVDTTIVNAAGQTASRPPRVAIAASLMSWIPTRTLTAPTPCK